MNPMIIFLTRPQHDALIDIDNALRKKAFAETLAQGKPEWSLAGVRLTVTEATGKAIDKALGR